jgi:WD40 repeat protein
MAPVRAESAASDTLAAMRLLKTNCFSCHNEEKKKGGLVMTSREAILKGGESGPSLLPGAPEKSPLIAALPADADPHMPPKKQLSATQIDLLARWVKEGATWDAASLVDQPSPPRAVSLAPPPPSYRPVLAMALSPDATRLAVGCGNEVVLYDVAGKEPAFVARASGHPDPVQSVAWSPDGKQLATGAFRRIVLWKSEPLTPDGEITAGLTDRIAALRFLSDGKQLIAADGRVSENGTLRIVDAGSRSIAASWTAHGDTIFDLALSGDGKLLATAGGDKLVKIWDLATRKEAARLEGHVSQVFSLAFDPTGAKLVTGGADQQLKVWDVKTRERVIGLGKHVAAINAVVWVPTGPTVFAVTDGGGLMRYTDLKPHTGAQSSDSAREQKFESAGTDLHCVAATANAERVFAGSYDGHVFVWSKEGKVMSKMDAGESKTGAPAPP